MRLVDVWPGIDVATRIESGQFEYDLLVSPGADLRCASIEVEGAAGLRLDSDGALVIQTVLGPVRQSAPRTWQVMPDGRREPVRCEYTVVGKSQFRFDAPQWDKAHALVIDPGLVYSTFLGGMSLDAVYALALDATGAVTLAGRTESASFPITPGAYDPSPNGASSSYVTRLSANGNALVYSTFFGGSDDLVRALAAVECERSGDCGGRCLFRQLRPRPQEHIRPVGSPSAAAPQTVSSTRFNASGNALVYSTFLGGMNHDEIDAIALNATGEATVE